MVNKFTVNTENQGVTVSYLLPEDDLELLLPLLLLEVPEVPELLELPELPEYDEPLLPLLR